MPTSRRKPPALRNLKSYYVEGDELREPVWIQIRTILMEHWDPIGISDEPKRRRRVRLIHSKAKTLIKARAPIESVMDYLDWIASERMGFTRQPERGRAAAERLLLLSSQLSPKT